MAGSFPDTVLYMEEDELGTGVLMIEEDKIQWKSSTDDKEVLMSFPNVAIHAVSRDTSVFPYKPCVLFLYSVPDEEEPEEETTTSYRICTQELGELDTIFELVSEYQQLYPDPELSGESGEEEEEEEEITEDTEYFTTAEGLEHLSIEGQATLSHLDGILRVQENGHDTNGQFDDSETS